MKSLEAVARFQAGEHASALATFMELNINPARVVALFPESVAGRLSKPRSEWIPLFGGPSPKAKDGADSLAAGAPAKDGSGKEGGDSAAPDEPATSVIPSASGLMGRFKSPLDAIRPVAKDPETASIASTTRRPPPRTGISHTLKVDLAN